MWNTLTVRTRTYLSSCRLLIARRRTTLIRSYECWHCFFHKLITRLIIDLALLSGWGLKPLASNKNTLDHSHRVLSFVLIWIEYDSLVTFVCHRLLLFSNFNGRKEYYVFSSVCWSCDQWSLIQVRSAKPIQFDTDGRTTCEKAWESGRTSNNCGQLARTEWMIKCNCVAMDEFLSSRNSSGNSCRFLHRVCLLCWIIDRLEIQSK